MQGKKVRMVVPCQNCSGLIINPFVGAGMAIQNRVRCPTCKTLQLMPDTFWDGDELIVRLQQIPVQVVKELVQILEKESPAVAAERIRKDSRFAKLHEWILEWIPSTPEKLNTELSIVLKLLYAYLALRAAGELVTLEQLVAYINRGLG